MKTTTALFLVLFVAVLSVTAASAADKPANYFAIKGGIYSPSETFDLNNFNGGTTTRLDNHTGFAGELAVGHYFLPIFAIELGAGYFDSRAHPATPPGDTRFRVVPAVATGKAFLPLGPIEPYGEFGIGAYFTKAEVEGNVYNFTTSTRITYGLHAGAGINFNLTDKFFIGAEGRYIWVKPSFGGQDVRLNGFTTTGDLGFRF